VKVVRLSLLLSLAFLPGLAAHAQNGFYSSMVSGQCNANGQSQNTALPESVGLSTSGSAPQNIVAGFSWTSTYSYNNVGVSVVISNPPTSAQAYILSAVLVASKGGSIQTMTTADINPASFGVGYKISPVAPLTNPYQTINNLFGMPLSLSPGTYTVMLYSTPDSLLFTTNSVFQWETTTGSEMPTPDGLNGITDGGIDLAAGSPLPNDPNAKLVATPTMGGWMNSAPNLTGRNASSNTNQHNAALCFDVHGVPWLKQTISMNLSPEWIWLNKPVSCTLNAVATSGGPINYSLTLLTKNTKEPIATLSNSGSGIVFPYCSGSGSGSGTVLNIFGYGQFTVTATQAGTNFLQQGWQSDPVTYQLAAQTETVNVVNPLVAVPHTP